MSNRRSFSRVVRRRRATAASCVSLTTLNLIISAATILFTTSHVARVGAFRGGGSGASSTRRLLFLEGATFSGATTFSSSRGVVCGQGGETSLFGTLDFNSDRLQAIGLPRRSIFKRRTIMSESTAPASAETSSGTSSSSSIADNLALVRQRMEESAKSCGRDVKEIKLIAVSKTKPIDMLVEAYEAGQRDFGENYAQELMQKAEQLADKDDIRWHFIGPLQSNKASNLVKSCGTKLACIQTVATTKLASKLNNAVENHHPLGGDREEGEWFRLGIFLQINTSGEESKSGLLPEDASAFAVDVASDFQRLRLDGLMTIGAPGDYTCFDTLVKCREEVAEALGCPPDTMTLSMGMSGDYEEAIKRGATNIRVGSTIFGARDYTQKK